MFQVLNSLQSFTEAAGMTVLQVTRERFSKNPSSSAA
jgi:hypothetical protein